MNKMMINTQAGSTLFISLIMLVVISLIGLSSVRMAQTDEIMAENFEDKAFALEVAEQAVKEVENWIVSNQISGFDLAVQDCEKTNCFNDNCIKGMCLTAYIDENGQCIQSKTQPWSDTNIQSDYPLMSSTHVVNVWEDNKLHQFVTNKYSNEFGKAKYIVEFICFSANSEELNSKHNFKDKNSWSELFRITVVASGKQKHNRVMLQSIFKQGRI